MPDKLWQLRCDTYQAAGAYHQACGAYIAALTGKPTGNIQEARQQVFATAEEYKIMLNALLAYLNSAEPGEAHAGEIQETERTIETLDRELALIPKL